MSTILNIDPSMGQEPDEPLGDPPVVPDEPGDQTPTEETLLRVQLRNGKTFTGKTEREIMEAMAQEFERQQSDAQTRETQTREAQGKVRYQMEHRAPEQFDAQKYLDLLGTNPMQAIDYSMRHYLGLAPDEDPANVIRFTYHVADKIADSYEIAQFRQNFPDSVHMTEEDAAKVLHQIDAENLQLTGRNLGAVYSEMLSRGQISKPTDGAANIKYQDVELTPKVSRGASAPRGTGAGGGREAATSSGKTRADYESMTLEQLTAEARKRGML